VPLVYRSEEHLKLHPFGKMPVLRHGTNVIYETLAITHYIDRAFAGQSLQPPGALGQARMLQWISIINAYVFPVMNRFTKEKLVKPIWGIEPDESFVASSRDALAQQIRLIDDTLADHHFLVGENLTLADSFLLPHLLFFGLTAEGASLLSGAPAAGRWLSRLRERDSFARNPMSGAVTAMAARGRVTPPIA
jgi:glutathione S-transferase